MSLDEIMRLFAHHPSRWWITGGYALELHLNRSWRDHEDSDVSVLRSEVSIVRSALAGWDLQVAAAGVLIPWDGEPLHVEAGQNNVWARPHVQEPWCLDLTIGDGDADCWVYRRDPNLKVSWDEAVLRTTDGTPYLAPELQLLFKSKNCRPKDNLDAEEVIPELNSGRQIRLRDALPEDHPWRSLLPR